MNKEEQQLHLNNIIKGIEEIQEEVRGMSYQEFTEENQVKEAVYMNLEMVGQAAYELANNSDNVSGLNFKSDVLSGFRNARYNEEAELDNQVLWGVIQNDLDIIRDDAIEASAELGRPADDDLHEENDIGHEARYSNLDSTGKQQDDEYDETNAFNQENDNNRKF